RMVSENKNLKVIAGGTDILVKEKKETKAYNFISLSDLKELNVIKEDDGHIIIGATVTHADINKDEIINKKAKSLAIACGVVGSPQIRNMGTIGGNIVNASPAADSIPPLLIHDAVCILETMDKKREIPLSDFIVAPYKTSIKDDELLTYVHIKGLYGYKEGYEKVAKRASLAIARLSIAWAIKVTNDIFEDVRISIGSCTPMPFRPKEVENFLKGKEKIDTVIKDAVSMILKGIIEKSGMRPSYRYKLPVLEGLLTKILRG
ncbi:MAG TPA: FAD binding domain-containing protein, partial [Syntrophorhabdaceae bacterium]|nr:FAD binding domain-containing protein [Syntrophorhabdaceae bacterium]